MDTHIYIHTQEKQKENWKLTSVHKNIDDYRLFLSFILHMPVFSKFIIINLNDTCKWEDKLGLETSAFKKNKKEYMKLKPKNPM